VNTDDDTTTWTKSSLSAAGNCVEVANLPSGAVAVRHSRDHSAVQVYTPGEWQAFIGGVKNGEFDSYGRS